MVYKEFRNGRIPFLIMRERATGSTFSVRCTQKGPGDQWAVKRCAEWIDRWGLAEVRLMIRSGGEPAIKAFRSAVKEARSGKTSFGTSPPRDPQSNGVAERAVKEAMRSDAPTQIGT